MPAPHVVISPSPADASACRVQAVARPGSAASGGYLSTVATADLPAGAAILFVDGEEVARASRYSVQVGIDRHIDAGDCGEHDGSSGRFVWRFLNHSCDPNAVLHGRRLVARRPIAAGEDITFDYEANEWQMAEPFPCQCGAARCRGWIRGFAHLSPRQRRELAAITAPYLLALAPMADAPSAD